MNPRQVSKIIAILLLIIGIFMIIPTFIAFFLEEIEAFSGFTRTLILIFGLSGIILYLLRNYKAGMLSTRDGFLFVSFSWIFASLFGALPFYISGAIPHLPDALFETVSGFTTTGASILTDIESLPQSLLFWRSLTHWLGGMGIVVLTVAILPLLGIGGLQLIKAEAPGPTVDKISPRITETAKRLWMIYIGFTIAETLLLVVGGMNLFDALTHTFGTLATGGFSPKNGSVGHYNSPFIDWVVTVFMILAGINFALHYRLLTGNIQSVFKDTEFRAFLSIFLIATAIITFSLYDTVSSSVSYCLRLSGFQAASILTTTGYATTDFEQWPSLARMTLFILMFIGGCSGSTGGGIKVIRIVTLLKQAFNEMKLLIHPRGIFTLTISGNTIRKNVVYAIAGFFFLYIAMLLIISFVVALSGQDILTAVSTALVTLGNIGPGFGNIGPTENYSFYPDYVKWTLSFAMLVGRLELYTVLVLFTPAFWRK